MAAARAVSEEDVGIGSDGLLDQLGEWELRTALGVKVEGYAEAEAGIARHGGNGEVG